MSKFQKYQNKGTSEFRIFGIPTFRNARNSFVRYSLVSVISSSNCISEFHNPHLVSRSEHVQLQWIHEETKIRNN